MQELAEKLRSVIEEAAPPVQAEEILDCHSGAPRVPPRPAGGHLPHPRRWLATAAAVVLVAGLVVGLTWPGNAPRHQRARPVPAPSTWRLAADLSAGPFQLAQGNPNAVVRIACGATTCFLSTDYGLGGAATTVPGSTYVSHDAGHTWSVSTLPAGVATTTAVSCVTESWCAAGAGVLDPNSGDPAAEKEMRDPILLVTADAGATWSTVSIPIPPDIRQLPASGSLPAEATYWPGIVDDVACTAPQTCTVFAHVSDTNGPRSGPMVPDKLLALHTTDGGKSWISAQLPETPDESGFEIPLQGGTTALACPTASNCVVMAKLVGFVPGGIDVWSTTDGGRSWHETRIPGLTSIASQGLTCPSATTCWAGPGLTSSSSPSTSQFVAYRTTDSGQSWSAVPLPAGAPAPDGGPLAGWGALSCTSVSTCFLGGAGIDETLDGGHSWTPAILPAQVGAVESLSCEVGGSCVAFASPPEQPITSSDLVLSNGTSVSASTRGITPPATEGA